MHSLALVGLALVVVRGSILARLRALWPALFGCAMCWGFWTGAIGGALFSFSEHGREPSPIMILIDAVTAAGVVSLGATVADFVLAFLDSHTTEKKP